MKKLIQICFFAVFFFYTIAYSDEQPAESESIPDPRIRDINVRHLFGVSASSVSGAGLSYMYYIRPNYHFKITGIYYEKTDEKTNNENQKVMNHTVFADGGMAFRRNFAVIKKPNTTFQFYTLAGGGYWYYKKRRPLSPEDNKEWKVASGGLGLGTGFLFVDKILINFDLCYSYFRGIGNKKRYAGPGIGLSCYVAY